jgi:predicted RNase H-like nuclease (RuvC/YqgF family)
MPKKSENRPSKKDRKLLVTDLARHLAVVDERCRELEKELGRCQEKNKSLKNLVVELKNTLRKEGK